MQKKLLRLHAKLCAELNIPVAKVKFLKRNRANSHNIGTYRIPEKTVVLYMDAIDDGNHNPFQTMAHETRHHYQNCKGWFGAIGELWKGDPAYIFSRLDYKDYPWEKDAYRYDKKISKREGWWTT